MEGSCIVLAFALFVLAMYSFVTGFQLRKKMPQAFFLIASGIVFTLGSMAFLFCTPASYEESRYEANCVEKVGTEYRITANGQTYITTSAECANIEDYVLQVKSWKPVIGKKVIEEDIVLLLPSESEILK